MQLELQQLVLHNNKKIVDGKLWCANLSETDVQNM